MAQLVLVHIVSGRRKTELMEKRRLGPLDESGKTFIISISEFTKFKIWYIFRQLKKEFEAYKAKSTAKKTPSAAKFKNCVNEPLLEGEDDELIIDRIPPPELHIHEGLTNKTARELNEEWGDDQFYKWCSRKNIKMENFHSNQLNGNACVDVQEAVVDLESELTASGRPELLRYSAFLSSFNKVRKACFGQDLLDSYENDVAECKEAYVKTGMSITTKAHILFEHVVDFCKKHGKGLGHFSEQAG